MPAGFEIQVTWVGEEASQIDLVVNVKAAKAPGIDIPATLLARADDVIEEG